MATQDSTFAVPRQNERANALRKHQSALLGDGSTAFCSFDFGWCNEDSTDRHREDRRNVTVLCSTRHDEDCAVPFATAVHLECVSEYDSDFHSPLGLVWRRTRGACGTIRFAYFDPSVRCRAVSCACVSSGFM